MLDSGLQFRTASEQLGVTRVDLFLLIANATLLQEEKTNKQIQNSNRCHKPAIEEFEKSLLDVRLALQS